MAFLLVAYRTFRCAVKPGGGTNLERLKGEERRVAVLPARQPFCLL